MAYQVCPWLLGVNPPLRSNTPTHPEFKNDLKYFLSVKMLKKMTVIMLIPVTLKRPTHQSAKLLFYNMKEQFCQLSFDTIAIFFKIILSRYDMRENATHDR